MKRRKFVQLGLYGGAALSTMKLQTFANTVATWDEVDQFMPVLFVGHGAPLYALGENKYTKAWREIGASIPRPRAIVCISAHWLTHGKTKVTAMEKPRTIHDFGRMDDRLYEMQYAAPGDPSLAAEIAEQLTDPHIHLDHRWGFDHGCWCVLYHMFPKADIPVLQFSIDYSEEAQYHFDLGKQLAFLRKKGVFIVCSGNIVHNLREIVWQESAVTDWATSFDTKSQELMDAGQFDQLIAYEKLGADALRSIPTPDHYFPLLYALGLKTDKDQLSYPTGGIAYGSTSMRSVLLTPQS